MEAKIVLGMGFGDEGKGLTTDFLSRTSLGPSVVLRFSGGQQAGHTVLIGDMRHTYSTFGSGTGRNTPTFLTEYCTFYPPNALNEYDVLIDKGLKPSLYVHPLAKLTTYWDVAWGRLRERIYAHGSCGIGVGATMTRNEQSPHKLFVVDLKHEEQLQHKLHEIGRYYGAKLSELKLEEEMETYFYLQVDVNRKYFFDSLMSKFVKFVVSDCIFGYDRLRSYSNFIFEGSQGILLDMEHGVFPNVTYASTTSKNALAICEQLGIAQLGNIDVFYVTRCYSTRHGRGWIPSTGPVKLINNEDEHNVHNEWQEDFKVNELDYELLKYALEVDNAYSWGYDKHLIVTCLDQRPEFKFDYSKLNRTFSSLHESRSPDSRLLKRII